MNGSETDRLRKDSSAASPPPAYLSIPLPPRKTPVSRSSGFPSPLKLLASNELTSQKKDSVPPTPREQQRRKEFLQSLVSAFIMNGLVAALLIFTVVQERTPPPPSQFEVSTQPDNKKPSREAANAPSTEATRARQEAASAAAPTTALVTTTAVQDFSITPELLTEFTPSLSPVEFTNPGMGASLQASNFSSIRSQRKEALKKFIESSTKGGNQGDEVLALSEEELRGLISTDDFGDGSGMKLLTDISGSMREIGEMVDSYVEKTFPKSSSAEIFGCSFKYLNDPVINEIIEGARRGRYTDFVFVCDLQDGEGVVAINRLRKFLVTEKRTIRLHVISFDQQPGKYLNKLIMDTGGAFTRVSRVTVRQFP